MGLIDRLRSLVAPPPRVPRGQAGGRAYAVGDIHGRADLLVEMLKKIDADNATRPAKRTFVVFLGDLIDRGPASAEVVEMLRSWQRPGLQPIFLAGNHEEVMLRMLEGETGILPSWLKFGGAECAASYGLDVAALKQLDERAALKTLKAAVPSAHRQFLEGFGDTFRFGDYLFVHAGIRPGVALDDQQVKDLRWVREPFLSDAQEHGFMVIHGHTVSEAVEERPNRIGIDTGAYKSGVLTALGIEDGERWFLSTGQVPAADQALRVESFSAKG